MVLADAETNTVSSPLSSTSSPELFSATLPGDPDLGSNYLVWGSVEIESTPLTSRVGGTPAGSISVTCTLSLGAATDSDSVHFVSGTSDIENIYLSLSSTITAGQQAEIDCGTSVSSDAATAERAVISAVQYTNGVPSPTPTPTIGG